MLMSPSLISFARAVLSTLPQFFFNLRVWGIDARRNKVFWSIDEGVTGC